MYMKNFEINHRNEDFEQSSRLNNFDFRFQKRHKSRSGKGETNIEEGVS